MGIINNYNYYREDLVSCKSLTPKNLVGLAMASKNLEPTVKIRVSCTQGPENIIASSIAGWMADNA